MPLLAGKPCFYCPGPGTGRNQAQPLNMPQTGPCEGQVSEQRHSSANVLFWDIDLVGSCGAACAASIPENPVPVVPTDLVQQVLGTEQSGADMQDGAGQGRPGADAADEPCFLRGRYRERDYLA